MTDIDLADLRLVAEQASDTEWLQEWWADHAQDWAHKVTGVGVLGDYIAEVTPTTLLSLLDRLERAEALPVRVEWGHRYPDGSVIPDSSETVAKSRAAISRARGSSPLVLMRRTVGEWEELDV